ncbi:MAG: prephenate dehydratase [Alistipes sp.]|nr:prephenate dehydratase [Alistipes sp.]
MSEIKRVAIQGYEGSFHHIVARAYYGAQIEIVPCATFREVARQVESGASDAGVMAVENSIAGTILPNLGILHNSHVQVVGEYYLHIRQNLMALPGTTLEQVREVWSHPMALLQCVDFLDAHRWKLVETEDTARSAYEVAQRQLKGVAAIAGDLAAQLFGLEIVAPDIHAIKNNATRFLMLRSEHQPIDEQADKASLCFKTLHEHGSLLQVLKEMEDLDVNMTKLQSSPIPSEPWHYMFHIDLEFGSMKEYNRLIERMRRVTNELHVYGVYRKDALHKN